MIAPRLVALVALAVAGCPDRGRDRARPGGFDAGAVVVAAPDPRPRPAELAYLTLKVLGMS